ncbi:hypothetical protein TWF694_004291 [Orbilia ellipsospora]|uniref:Extracellular membrane protein CFEM domain-containing protein n=1 Tax=Orbilia ellipsospora TaxID=2528407 RepID=A0AAV9WXK2_9PEZI
MSLSPLLLILLLCIFQTPHSLTQQIPQYESYVVGTLSNWQFLNNCVTCCYDFSGCGGVRILPDAIGCHLNSCICRKDAIATSATSFLRSCLSQQCNGNSIDISGGIGAYNDYCSIYTANSVAAANSKTSDTNAGGSSSGQDATPAPVVSTETVALKTTTEIQTSLVTVGKVTSFITQFSTVHDAQATGQSSGGGGSGPLNQSSKIALGVGLGIGIPILGLLGAIAVLLSRRNKEVDLPVPPPESTSGGGAKLGDEQNPTLTGGIYTETFPK